MRDNVPAGRGGGQERRGGKLARLRTRTEYRYNFEHMVEVDVNTGEITGVAHWHWAGYSLYISRIQLLGFRVPERLISVAPCATARRYLLCRRRKRRRLGGTDTAQQNHV